MSFAYTGHADPIAGLWRTNKQGKGSSRQRKRQGFVALSHPDGHLETSNVRKDPLTGRMNLKGAKRWLLDSPRRFKKEETIVATLSDPPRKINPRRPRRVLTKAPQSKEMRSGQAPSASRHVLISRRQDAAQERRRRPLERSEMQTRSIPGQSKPLPGDGVEGIGVFPQIRRGPPQDLDGPGILRDEPWHQG